MFESTRSFLNEGTKPTWSSEKHNKKAYYRFAKKSHPDKFPDPTRRQAATEAFRELHYAYEDQLCRYQLGEPTHNHGEYGDQDSSETEKNEEPRTSDSEIRQKFEANDLKRERMEGVKTANRRGIKVVLDMWASQKKEQCWKAALQGLMLLSDIRELSNELRESDPELSEFLRKKQAEASSARSGIRARKESTRVARINREWSSSSPHGVSASLERWARQEWMPSEYEGIAKRVENPEAAQAIRLWEIRGVEQTDRKRSKLKREIADGIVACNAEVTQSRRLLSSLLLSEYEDIYKMLPAEVLERLTADQAGAARNDMEEVKQSSSGRSTRTNKFIAWIFGLMD